eukprot:6174065-Pleurochrysis_carterae.AAC.1
MDIKVPMRVMDIWKRLKRVLRELDMSRCTPGAKLMLYQKIGRAFPLLRRFFCHKCALRIALLELDVFGWSLSIRALRAASDSKVTFR